jgi:hypothetical protein
MIDCANTKVALQIRRDQTLNNPHAETGTATRIESLLHSLTVILDFNRREISVPNRAYRDSALLPAFEAVTDCIRY